MTNDETNKTTTGEARSYPAELPLVPLREAVVFPKLVVPLGVGREKSVNAINIRVGRGNVAPRLR